MAEFRHGTGDQPAFRRRLLEAGILIDTSVPGVYGRNGTFESIRTAFSRYIGDTAALENPEQMRFPPLVPRTSIERSGYLRSFPHLAGTVFAFEGDDAAAAEQLEQASCGEDWSGHQHMTDLVLTPAGCYGVYPAIGARDPLAAGGLMVDVGDAAVFRHEPSDDPARMQMFHQRELVRIGEPETVLSWRDDWRDRAVDLLCGLGLDARPDVAADPFFGRTGRMLATAQRQQALKFEIEIPIGGDERTAVASFNFHQGHFADTYGIEMAAGGPAYTACLGFGEERVTLALLYTHGLDPDRWPPEVRERLWPERAV